ncbi:LOW QUALITY PROTEIN: hypothetical protein PHMEG_00033885 [Phytophthora megakarya]|uniref:Uncharacterized protein n=1 Tax=Phytophthora megakarya TaxID=4795 RepID=A0A225UUQ2_9STRA|nr:LOW QUALITY PROTEIN: hypothetical protein PHMEG_00033885 [Phytophthora megakarya]
MQNNGLDVELQRTLNELCTDLFITSALDDCSAILQSLALLAETFPQAQSLLGRLLSRFDDSPKHPRTVSKLSALSTEFLYNNETAHSGVCLLAALANDNVRNQRRIVQNVTARHRSQQIRTMEQYSSNREASSSSRTRTGDGESANENCKTVVYPVVFRLLMKVSLCRVTVTNV